MGAAEGEALKTSFKCLRAKVPIRLKDMSCCNAEVFTSASHQVLQAVKIWRFVSAAALVDLYIRDIFPTSTLAAAQTCHLGKDKKKPWKSRKRAALRQQGLCLKAQFVVDHMRVSVNPQAEEIQQLSPQSSPVLFTLHPQWRVLCRLMNVEFLQMSRWRRETKWSRLPKKLNIPSFLPVTRNEAFLIIRRKLDVVCESHWCKSAHESHREWFKDRGWRQLSCQMKMHIHRTPPQPSGRESGTKVWSNCIFCSCGAPHVCAVSDIIVDYSC